MDRVLVSLQEKNQTLAYQFYLKFTALVYLAFFCLLLLTSVWWGALLMGAILAVFGVLLFPWPQVPGFWSKVAFLAASNTGIFICSSTLGQNAGAHYGFFATLGVTFAIFNSRDRAGLVSGVVLSILFFVFTHHPLVQIPPVFELPELVSHAMIIICPSLAMIFVSGVLFRQLRMEAEINQQIVDMELASRQTNQIWEATFEQTQFGVVMRDMQGQLIRANSKYCQMFGYSEEELKILPPSVLLPKPPKNHEPDAILGLMRLKQLTGVMDEWQLRHKSGRLLWIQAQYSVINDSNQNPEFIVGTLFDITTQKAMEKVLENQRQAIETSSRLASLGEMAAGIAHEINNPIQIILGWTAHILLLERDKVEPDAMILQHAANIESMAFRVAEIIKSIQGMGKRRIHSPRTLSTRR